MTHPEVQIALLSETGYKELSDLAISNRLRYPDLYTTNDIFTIWSNSVPRTSDSAITYARAFGGPNATTTGKIVILNSTYPLSGGNTLATSDNCPSYIDNSGGNYTSTWAGIYIPQIKARISKYITGNFTFANSEVALIGYLCGFETQILGRRSQFCDVFTEEEMRDYEYAQDLRYWYGTGTSLVIMFI